MTERGKDADMERPESKRQAGRGEGAGQRTRTEGQGRGAEGCGEGPEELKYRDKVTGTDGAGRV